MTSFRPFSRSVVAAAGAAILAVVPAAAATAASSSAPGYVRLAHLSPDTLQVDVTLSALSGGTVLYELDGVGYGAVSKYMPLSAGTYAIAMVPAGSPDGTTPVVNASIEVTAGGAATVAALGRNADLETIVIDDDLSAGGAETARVRAVQASVLSDDIDVSLTDGTAIASDLRFGDASAYVDLPSGTAEVSLISGLTEDVANVDLVPAASQTLFVLDDADGALTVVAALDSAAVTQAPIGGVETGGGALAEAQQRDQLLSFAGIGALLVAGAALLFARTRRTPAERVRN